MTPAPTPTLEELFDLYEADINAVEFYSMRSASVQRSWHDYLAAAQRQRPDWLTADDDEAKLIRRIHARLSGTKTSRTPRGALITVEQFAERVGMSRSTADGLLAKGLVYGAVRKTPGLKNSPWLIPESAVERHFESWEARS